VADETSPLPPLTPSTFGIGRRPGFFRRCLYEILQTVGAQLTIDVARRLVIHTFSGVLSDEDISDLPSKVRAHPDFDPTFFELLDFSGVTAGTVSTAAISAAAQRKTSFIPTARRVIIAPQDHIFGLARMGQAFAERTRPSVSVVRTMAEARKVLGIE
jgi:hypothetical protein